MDLKDLKLPHSIKCKCGKRAKFLGEDKGEVPTKVALCQECYDLRIKEKDESSSRGTDSA